MKKFKTKANLIKRIGFNNELNGLILLIACCSNMLRFYSERKELLIDMGSLAKRELGWPSALPNEIARSVYIDYFKSEKKPRDSLQHATELRRFFRPTGTKYKQDIRKIILLSNW